MAERAGAKRSRGSAKKTSRSATKPVSRTGIEAKTVAELREALRKNLAGPTAMVMLSRDRIEEALDRA